MRRILQGFLTKDPDGKLFLVQEKCDVMQASTFEVTGLVDSLPFFTIAETNDYVDPLPDGTYKVRETGTILTRA